MVFSSGRLTQIRQIVTSLSQGILETVVHIGNQKNRIVIGKGD